MNPGEQHILVENGVTGILERIADHLAALRETQGRSIREWLSIQEVADELGVSGDTITRLIGSGKLKATVITTSQGRGCRRRYRIKREWLDAYLLANAVTEQSNLTQAKHRKSNKPTVDFIGD